MSKFSVGERVRCNQLTGVTHVNKGWVGIIKRIDGNYLTFTDSSTWGFTLDQDWFDALYESKEPKPIKKQPIMKKLSNFYKKLTDENTQALVKAGYLNGDLEPTQKAQDAINEINFFALKDQLVERAKAEIKEAEESK
jgi:hypothetical protein